MDKLKQTLGTIARHTQTTVGGAAGFDGLQGQDDVQVLIAAALIIAGYVQSWLNGNGQKTA